MHQGLWCPLPKRTSPVDREGQNNKEGHTTWPPLCTVTNIIIRNLLSYKDVQYLLFFYIISVKPNMLLILCMLYVWLGKDETDKWTIPPLLTLKHERLKSILHLLSSSQPFYNHLFHCKDTWERSRPVTANYTKTKQAVDHLFVCVKRSCCMPVFLFF